MPASTQLAIPLGNQWRDDPWRLSPRTLQVKLKIQSRVNIALFELLLKGYDALESSYVLNGLKTGFAFGVPEIGPFPPSKLWAPSHVSPEDRLIINVCLAEEIAASRLFGPFLTPPRGLWKDTVSYPMSIILKKDGTPRIISNLSHGGKTSSVNGFIPKSETKTSYPSLYQVAQAIMAVGLKNACFAIFDIQSAFRNLLMSAEDWKYSIISWQSYPGGPRIYFLDPYMTFGGASFPRIFNRFGSALEYILRDSCFIRDAQGLLLLLQRLIRYLDDHLIIAASAIMVNQILQRMLSLMKRLNIPVKDIKTIPAMPTAKFLGYFWVPRSDLISLDSRRWLEVEGRLSSFLEALYLGLTSAQDLRCLTGLLVWCSVVIPTAKTFLRGCHTTLSRLKATSLPASEARLIAIVDPVLISDVSQDLTWWGELCISFRESGSRPTGIKISEVVTPHVFTKEDCALIFYSDASNWGIGGYQHGPVIVVPYAKPISLWCFCPLPAGMTMSFLEPSGDDPERRVFINNREVGSGYTEAAGLLFVLSCFLPTWAAKNPHRQPGVGIYCHTDSFVVVDMWASKRAGVTLLPYLRAFAHLSALFNVTLIIVHIPGKLNQIADSISRQKMRKFRSLLPDSATLPTQQLFAQQIYF